MNETVILVSELLMGILLGVLFFGGLWWTVRRGALSKQPAIWFFFSPLVRISIVLAGFYFVAGGNWLRLLLCLTGFVTARFIVMRLTRSAQEPACRTTVATHAT